MDTVALKLKPSLVLLRKKGIDLNWNNNEIISWYSAEGRKLETKSKYKKTPLAIVYLLRRNDLKTIADNERTITNIKEIEKERSEELQKLRAQVDSFKYEKQSWARQSEAMAKKTDELEKKIKNGNHYISALEDCCDNAGFPVAAVKQAAVSETLDTGIECDSDDEDDAIAALQNKTRRITRNRAQEDTSQRSPVKTRTKSSDLPQKSVRVAVLKTVTNANDEITTISRPLTCEECSRHKQVVGIMPRRGPFQPYWETLMLQATVYKLEVRDVWQIALLTIPDELKPKLTTEMKSGNIISRKDGETNDEIFDRLRTALLNLRGPTHADWDRILEIRQAPNEAFETYAERLWVTYKEHSGLENACRDHDVLIQLLKNHAGAPVQKALLHGVDPAENTFRAVVDWGSKIENRWKNKPRTVASTQWLTEGKSIDESQTQFKNKKFCHHCRRNNHLAKDCRKKEKVEREQLKQNQTTLSSVDSELLRQFAEFRRHNQHNSGAHNASEMTERYHSK